MADLNEFNEKRPKLSEENLAEKKGIKTFFGEAEAAFFESVGKEITNKILQESFVLYRIDLKRTKTHSLYGEAKRKEWKPEVEIFGRVNIESVDPSTQVKGGLVKKGFGELTAHVYISHLEELNLVTRDSNNLKFDFRNGDFIGYKGQFYRIRDDGFSNIGNKFSYGSDRRFYLTIIAVEVDEDIFKGR